MPDHMDNVETAWDQLKVAMAEVERLRAAIRKHRDQRSDDRCFLDDRELYMILPETDDVTIDTHLPTKCEFMESCSRFWEQRQCPSDRVLALHEMTIRQLEDEVERLRQGQERNGP